MSSQTTDDPQSRDPAIRSRHDDGERGGRHGQDRGNFDNFGSDGDESGNVLGNREFLGNTGRHGRGPAGASHGAFGPGGESSLGGLGDHPDRGIYDGRRGGGWGGRPGGRHQDQSPGPFDPPERFGAPAHLAGFAGAGGRGDYGPMGQGSSGLRDHDRPDAERRGSHAGRGPRGYRRSDARLSEEIHQRLTDHPEIDASDIDVAVSAGEVTLTGRVEDRRTRHLAEDVVAEVPGVVDVQNRLRYDRGPRTRD